MTFCDCQLDAPTQSRCALGKAGWEEASLASKKQFATAYFEEILGVSIPTNPSFERTPKGFVLTYSTSLQTTQRYQAEEHTWCKHDEHWATFAEDGLMTENEVLSSTKVECPWR